MASQNKWETQPRKDNGEFTFRYKYSFWKGVLAKIATKTDKEKIDNTSKGGSYGDLSKITAGNKNVEIHHMPSVYASNLSKWKGPCIILSKSEHYNTASHSRMNNSKEYRKAQKKLIKSGKFIDAEIMDIIDVLKKTGEKYVKSLSEKLDYDLKLYKEGKING